MNIGPFYFDRRELLLLILTFVLGLAFFYSWNLGFAENKALLTIAVIILISKGLLPGIHNEPFFILALVALVLTSFMPVFQVFLFYCLSFVLFRLFKVI